MNNEERIERINAMRAMLDFVEANPELRMPYDLHLNQGWSIYAPDLGTFLKCVEAFGVAPTIEGRGDAIVNKQFGPFRLQASFTLSEMDEPERFRKEVPSVTYEWDADAFLRAVMDAKDAEASA